jgi:hypothetical protein
MRTALGPINGQQHREQCQPLQTTDFQHTGLTTVVGDHHNLFSQMKDATVGDHHHS